VAFKNELYTPGKQTPGKPEIIGFEQSVADTWAEMQSRLRDLSAQLARVKNEIEKVKTDLAFLVVERCEYKAECKRLGELRLEAEAIELGIDAIEQKSEILKRNNIWLTS